MRYYWLTANPKTWIEDYNEGCTLETMPVGVVKQYSVRSASGALRKDQSAFFDIRPGDLLLGYESSPVKCLVALLECVEACDGQHLRFKKKGNLPKAVSIADIKAKPELRDSRPVRANNQGSIFELTGAEAFCLAAMAGVSL